MITEPIINLRVSINCGPNINRDYVLLLDPAPLVTLENDLSTIEDKDKSPIKKSPNHATSHKFANKKTFTANFADESISAASTQMSTEPTLDKPARVHHKAKKILAEPSSADRKLLEAYTGKPQATPSTKQTSNTQDKSANNPSSKNATDKSYLVISGGNENSTKDTTKPSLSLRLETQIDLARIEPLTPPLGTEEVMDEVMVMTNRLAHLEKQIISLQLRNTQLVTEAEKAKNEGFSFTAFQSNWLQYLLITLGLVSALACAEWLRRKMTSNRLDNEQASWFDVDATEVKSETPPQNTSPSAEPAIFSKESYDSTYSVNRGTVFDNATKITDDDDEHESILDNVEVFIAHGRPMLAIQLLQNYLSDFPTESPAIWLKLLALLAKDGSASEYDAAALECKQFFNIKLPSFTDAVISDTSTIEDYPYIVARLEGVWGSPFAVGFLSDLIYNKSSQPREGFERNTFEELFFLKQIAEMLNPPSNLAHQHSFYHPDATKSTLDKVTLNEAMFTDIEPLDISESLFNAPNTSKNGADNAIPAQPSVPVENIPSQSAPSYDAGMLLNAEKTLALNDDIDTSKSTLLQSAQSIKIDDAFHTDDIDISTPGYQIDLESAPEINIVDEEIVIGSSTFSAREVDENIELDLFKSKPPAKTKAKKQTQANVIEWDLPANPDEISSK